jgi:hypothetical protein
VSERQNIEQRAAKAAVRGDWWTTPEDALRDLRFLMERLAETGRRYPLNPEEMVIPRDVLAEALATARKAEEQFKGFTRVVTLPGPIG